MNVDAAAAIETVHDCICQHVRYLTGNVNGPQMEAALKSLYEKTKLNLTRKQLPLNCMIFNLENKYDENLEGIHDFFE